MRPPRAGALLVGALTCGLTMAGQARDHAPAGAVEPAQAGARSQAGAVESPPNVYRPPVVLIVAGTGDDGVTALVAALKANGIASVRDDIANGHDSSADVEAQVREAALRLAALRNDAQFPTVSVIGRGAAAGIAAIAARFARADGFVPMSAGADARADIARLVAPVQDAVDGERGAKAIADFLRTVPALGRRGTREARPVTPRLSPRAVAIATIGGTLVGIEFGQPQKRGRAIWGGLVPWNRIWMPGADEATTLCTSVPMFIGDLMVPAGDHTFYLWPREDRVDLVVSTDVGQFHIVYDAGRELGRAALALTKRADVTEGLTFAIEPRDERSGLMTIRWDDREYGLVIRAAR